MPGIVRESVRAHRLHLSVLAGLLLAYPLLMPAPSAPLDPLFVIVNVGVAALLVLWAVKVTGLAPSELGLSRDTLRRSLLLGGLVGLLAPAMAFGLAQWDTFREMPWWGEFAFTPQFLVYRVAFRIPLGTALFEEVAFRGVLFGMLLREGKGAAIWLSSALFGLYHVGPTVRLIDSSGLQLSRTEVIVLVAGGAVFTFLVGLVFAAVRYKSRNVAGPTLTHWMADACATLLVFALG